MPVLEHNDFITDANLRLFTDGHHLHAEDAVGGAALIDSAFATKGAVGLGGVSIARDLVDVGHFAARGAAGDVVFVVADLDAFPRVFVVGFWAGDCG